MYHIKKIVAGNANILHKDLRDIDTAKDILICISSATKRNGRKVIKHNLAVDIDDGNIVYQIAEG